MQNKITFSFYYVIGAVLLVAELLLCFQGFELCDEGWVLSAYQQFLKNPAGAQYQFLYYNALVIGSFWNLVFGSAGIAAFRVLDALFIVLTGLLVYRILKDLVNRWLILLGLLACIFSRDWGSMVFNHNSISAFLAILAVFFLLRGLNNNKRYDLILAFAFVGINVFSRLPNMTLLALIILPFISYLYTRDRRSLVIQLLSAISGFCLGIILVLLSMYLSGRLNYLWLAFHDLGSAGSDPESTHQLSMMIKVYLGNYLTVFKQAVALVIIAGIFLLSQQKLKNTGLKKVALVLAIVLFSLALLHWKSAITWSYTVTGIILLASLIYYKNNQKLTLAITCALLVAHLLPLGSDFGIGNMGYVSLWLALPLSFGLLARMIGEQAAAFSGSAKILAICSLAFFFLRQGYVVSQMAYFDPGSRTDKVYKVDNPLVSTYTSRIRAEVMNELLHHLSFFVKPDDYLLCFQSLPMVNYLTETRPYLGNSWVWTYDPRLMAEKFVAAKQAGLPLPVIVREKCQPLSGKWTVPLATYNREDLPTDYEYKASKIKIINSFINEYRYRIVWQNDLFQILVPENFKAEI